MAAENPPAGAPSSAALGGPDLGDRGGIGNYKGVMLCNRPAEPGELPYHERLCLLSVSHALDKDLRPSSLVSTTRRHSALASPNKSSSPRRSKVLGAVGRDVDTGKEALKKHKKYIRRLNNQKKEERRRNDAEQLEMRRRDINVLPAF